MPVASYNRLAIPLIDLVNDHQCAYAERVLEADGRNLGLTAYKLLTLIHTVAEVHADSPEGQCPPTHINSSPTKAWSDLVRDTKA